jgi:glycosyltransferase involved in cell wall biosynthesis
MMVAGIDASRNRSGGAVAHLRGVLNNADPREFGFDTVHLWAHDALLDAVASKEWLVKHLVPATRKPLFDQLIWQATDLPRLARQLGVSVMFNTADGSVCPFRPYVTLSQNALPFVAAERARMGLVTSARLRLELLRFITHERMKHSDAAIFLSDYARNLIGAPIGLIDSPVISHGIDQEFFEIGRRCRKWPTDSKLTCLYISTIGMYKHQWNVVEAISIVRERTGLDIRLRLVGGGGGPPRRRLEAAITRYDPNRSFVTLIDFAPRAQILSELEAADFFVFASSCENLPITLLEAMAAGLPIASSDLGPMKEVLGPDGSFFDPERTETIVPAVLQVVTDAEYRERLVRAAVQRAAAYSWQRCARETWQILASVALRNSRGSSLSTETPCAG